VYRDKISYYTVCGYLN